ncbi:MAG: FKBP-type peptidyl-prolyl cis-trans isomerase [Paludibacteraceae bacterium]|nr:FKBP-type peptidyl-prolyl cis-trans isomerase [Paludibacteraceae bacterium]
MKKIGFFFLAAALSISSVEAKSKSASKTASLATANDSVSYAIGIEFAKSVHDNLAHLPGGPFNEALLLEAFCKSFNNDTTSLLLKGDKTGDIIQTYLKNAQEVEAEKAKAKGKLFLEENKKNPNVKVTPSGLQYEVLKEGNGIKPAPEDKVKVNYKGTLVDGTVFDSSKEPVAFELNKVIPGWTEGLQLMKVGSKYKFYIPQELGYGARPAGSIPPYSVLIFEVELLDVAKAQVQAPASNGAKFQFPTYQRIEK